MNKDNNEEKISLSIWGRDWILDIYFDCFGDEEILQSQKEAINQIVENTQLIENAKNAVIEYILSRDKEKLGSVKIENIFKYVKPTSLIVKRNTDIKIVGLLLNYKFDVDNGIAVVFNDGIVVNVGEQDIIL